MSERGPEAPPLVRGGPAEKARKRRSLAIAIGLVAFVALVFLVTIVRLAQNTGKGPIRITVAEASLHG